jgi:hypothetical protein
MRAVWFLLLAGSSLVLAAPPQSGAISISGAGLRQTAPLNSAARPAAAHTAPFERAARRQQGGQVDVSGEPTIPLRQHLAYERAVQQPLPPAGTFNYRGRYSYRKGVQQRGPFHYRLPIVRQRRFPQLRSYSHRGRFGESHERRYRPGYTDRSSVFNYRRDKAGFHSTARYGFQ